MVVATILALPNFLPQNILSLLPRSYALYHLPLGVDLQGGSRLVVALPKTTQNQLQEIMDVLEKRLQALLGDDADYTLKNQIASEAQPDQQISIEVPNYFDSDNLKNIIIIGAHFSLYQQETQLNANDVLKQKKPIPDGLKLGYTLADPPVAFLMKTPALLNNNDMAKVTMQPFQKQEEPNQQATIRIDFKKEALANIDNKLAGIGAKSLILMFDDDILAQIDYSAIKASGALTLGPFAEDVAQNLQIVLSAPPLATDLTILEERTIGSDLGQANSNASLFAVFAAFAIVTVFMVIFYGYFGIIANIALLAHLFLLISTLMLLNVSLSLSGFAGLVLVIGISVDAIILIFERIKEAQQNNDNSVDTFTIGFNGAIQTIFDANMTTLIAAMALLLLGGSIIHGFALVVAIGMVTTFFTSISFTPLLMRFFRQKFGFYAIRQNPLGRFWQKSNLHFMVLGKFTLSLALLLSLITGALYFTAGINYGIDFVGGSLAVLEKKQGTIDLYDIRERALAQNIGNVTVNAGVKNNQAILTIPSQNLGENAEQTVAIKLNNEFIDDYQLERVDVVGTTISNALSLASIISIFTAFIAIFAYIYWRFSFAFALGALVTTLHDLVVMFFLFLILQWQFNVWSIAAILAIIGFSLNDTIVVYDRIRSLLLQNKQLKMAHLVDIAINKTLSRTILTSLASFLAHIPLYYFNGADIKDFAFQFLLGIVIGTYSSIFIAGPLLVLLGVKPQSLRQKNAKFKML